MALSFPSNPNTNDTYTENNITYTWDGEKWVVTGSAAFSMSGADIKVAYEGEADTNAFTDSDETKLDGIETAATADQTGGEIKAAYEAEADTNAFTDAEKSKLLSVELNATDDQTGAEIKALYEAEADTNAFTDADHAKLDTLVRQTDDTVQTHLESNTAAAPSVLNLPGGHTLTNSYASGTPTGTISFGQSGADDATIETWMQGTLANASAGDTFTVNYVDQDGGLRNYSAVIASVTVDDATSMSGITLTYSSGTFSELDFAYNPLALTKFTLTYADNFQNTITGSNDPIFDSSQPVVINGVTYEANSWTVTGTTATKNFASASGISQGDSITQRYVFASPELDAATLNGIQGASFVRSDADDTVTGNIDFTSTTVPITTGSIKFVNTENTGLYYTDASGVLAFDENFFDDPEYGTGTYDPTTVFTGSNGGGLLIKNEDGWGAIFTTQNSRFASAEWDNLKIGAHQVWHAGNDGSGSGLDADTLDGIEASSFIRSNENDNVSAHTEWQDNFEVRLGNSADIRMLHNGTDNMFNVYNGDLIIDLTPDGNNAEVFRVKKSANHIFSIGTGCNLYYDNAEKLDTQPAGTRLFDDIYPQTDGAYDCGTSSLRWNHVYTDNLTVTSTVSVRGAIDLADNDILRFGSGDDAEFFCNGSHFYLDLNGGIGNFYIRDGSTTRFTFNDNGAFTATGNITAFSDIRLKENIEVIPNALDKVSQIRGVTYDRNDMEDEPRQAGVVAQEVEKVLPEVVSINEDGIKSVAYGNLVSLLIEAVKEQQSQIEVLTERVNQLESN